MIRFAVELTLPSFHVLVYIKNSRKDLKICLRLIGEYL